MVSRGVRPLNCGVGNSRSSTGLYSVQVQVRLRRVGDPDPDPHQNVMDLQH